MDLDWILYLLIGIAGFAVLLLLTPLLRLADRWGKVTHWAGSVLVVVLVALAVLMDVFWRPVDGLTAQLPQPRASADGGFVTSKSCRACHPRQYESWHATYHRTMTQPARSDTILGAFEGRTLTSNYGATGRVEKQGDEFWVEVEDLDLVREADDLGVPGLERQEFPRIRRQVVMVTGSHFFQVYWIRSQKAGEYLQFPWRWHITEQRWMHSYDVFVGPEEEWKASGKGNYARVWNGSCTLCHTVGTAAGFDPLKGYYANTRVAELGISCEACHAPGQEHIRLQSDPLRRFKHHFTGERDRSIVNPSNCNAHVSSEICGQCHSHALPVHDNEIITGRTYRAGQKWSAHMQLETPALVEYSHRRFWVDGTERASGREFNGLAISACYLKGELSCSTCHSSHQGDRNHLITPKMLTNQACLPCHQKHVDHPQAHTHHASESSGSLCYNCHMPHTSLALLKAARSHRINNPRVTAVTSEQPPNACNLCHLDRSVGWTADRMHDWFGTARTKLSEEEQTVAAGVLWMLRGDAGQRAVAAWHAGWEPAQKASGTDWLTPLLTTLLDDPYAAVRFIANKSVTVLPGYADWPNEFDSTPATRQKAQQRLSERWQKSTGRIVPRKPLEPLFDAKGQLQPTVLQEIGKRRDDHAVHVEE